MYSVFNDDDGGNYIILTCVLIWKCQKHTMDTCNGFILGIFSKAFLMVWSASMAPSEIAQVSTYYGYSQRWYV